MNRPTVKCFACLLTALLLFTLVLSLVPASYVDLTGRDGTSAPAVEVYIRLINMYGNLVLSISNESMRTLGFEPGDVVTVAIGDKSLAMPIGTAYSNVNVNEPICCYRENVERGSEESAYLTELICTPLQSAFSVDALHAPGVDLSERAGQYLLRIGMTPDEISALKEKLSEDYGGLTADSAGLPSAA